MRALIADDEPVARAVLREHLDHFPAVEIVGEVANGAALVDAVARLSPDVVFLDINMPGLDGFAAVARLRGAANTPAVIFVTAHDDRALDAFGVGAVDYLLKPVRAERLAAAIDRARAASRPALPPPPPAPMRRIAARLGSDVHLLDHAQAIAFQAEGGQVTVISTRGRFEVGATLKELELRLPPAEFKRIHRAVIVNLNHVRRISPLSSKRWLVKMSNGLELIVSKRMSGAIRGELDAGATRST